MTSKVQKFIKNEIEEGTNAIHCHATAGSPSRGVSVEGLGLSPHFTPQLPASKVDFEHGFEFCCVERRQACQVQRIS